MKALLLVSSLILSLNAMADSLHCKGMDSRLEIHGADPVYKDSEATVEVWNRAYEQARYADLFDGYAGHATVKQLMGKKVITAESMHGTFKIDLEKKTILVNNRGNIFKDKVICEYRK